MKFTYTVERNWVDVVGYIWQPGTGPCAQTYTLTPHDVENIGEPTRENVQAWIDTHAGDFQSVADFHAVVGETDLPWSDEENEITFLDCMNPCEED